MKKTDGTSLKKLPEGHPDRYDWTRGKRGKFASRAAKASGLLRVLEADLARRFPDSREMNLALRRLLTIERVLQAKPSTRGRAA